MPLQVNGVIDELRIWDCVRTYNEILGQYQSTLLGTEEHLYLYWPMDEFTGYMLFDESRNLAHGKIVGRPKPGLWVQSDAPVEKAAVRAPQPSP